LKIVEGHNLKKTKLLDYAGTAYFKQKSYETKQYYREPNHHPMAAFKKQAGI